MIAEAGNTHFGCLKTAKEMIKIAKDCGADLVKFQAIEPDFVASYGSMPEAFYKHVAFSMGQYEELIEVGNMMGMPVFFSIFGKSLWPLASKTMFHKISAKQAPTWEFTDFMDKESTFVSCNPIYGLPPLLEKATILYATEYIPHFVDFDLIHSLCEYFDTLIGYSDHTVGIKNCVLAVKEHGCEVVEKHFTLDKNYNWEGAPFRDCIHSVLPKELEQLAKAMKGD